MKSIKEYNVKELSSIQMKDYSGGMPWWLGGIIFYVGSEIIEGIDDAYKRGCLKPQ